MGRVREIEGKWREKIKAIRGDSSYLCLDSAPGSHTSEAFHLHLLYFSSLSWPTKPLLYVPIWLKCHHLCESCYNLLHGVDVCLPVLSFSCSSSDCLTLAGKGKHFGFCLLVSDLYPWRSPSPMVTQRLALGSVAVLQDLTVKLRFPCMNMHWCDEAHTRLSGDFLSKDWL